MLCVNHLSFCMLSHSISLCFSLSSPASDKSKSLNQNSWPHHSLVGLFVISLSLFCYSLSFCSSFNVTFHCSPFLHYLPLRKERNNFPQSGDYLNQPLQSSFKWPTVHYQAGLQPSSIHTQPSSGKQRKRRWHMEGMWLEKCSVNTGSKKTHTHIGDAVALTQVPRGLPLAKQLHSLP